MVNSASSWRSAAASPKEGAMLPWRTILRSRRGLYPSVPSCRRWSRGEKSDPTGRTPPLLTLPLDCPGRRLQLPARPALGGRLAAAGGSATLGAARRRLVAGASVGVAADVAFEEPGSEVVAEQA